MPVRLLQPLNAQSPISLTESGISILVRLVQPANAPTPIFCTEVGIVISLSFSHPKKARLPMRSNPCGKSTSSKRVCPSKKRSSIDWTPAGTTTLRTFCDKYTSVSTTCFIPSASGMNNAKSFNIFSAFSGIYITLTDVRPNST